MSFGYNSMGVKPSGGIFSPIPDGEYILKIVDTVEGRTKNDDYKVTVDFKVETGSYKGRNIKFHTVTFFPITDKDNPPAGAGMAMHFLKCIGQPFEGNFQVDHMKWRGEMVKAYVTSEEYNGKVNNRVKGIESVMEKSLQDMEQSVPF